jgi:hypothetical protein
VTAVTVFRNDHLQYGAVAKVTIEPSPAPRDNHLPNQYAQRAANVSGEKNGAVSIHGRRDRPMELHKKIDIISQI